MRLLFQLHTGLVMEIRSRWQKGFQSLFQAKEDNDFKVTVDQLELVRDR